MSERSAILLAGVWPASSLHFNLDSGEMSLPDHLARRVAQHWQGARTRNPRLFDGPLVSLTGFAAGTNFLHLDCAVCGYRDLLFANALRENKEHELADQMPRALGISALLQTADEQLVLMHRSHDVGEYPGMIDVPGGHIDPYDLNEQGRADPFHAMRAELLEELGLDAPRLGELLCYGLVENRLCRKPELVFHAHTALTFAQVQTAAQSARDRFEFTRLASVPASPAAITEFLQQRGMECTPSCEGCLRLFLEVAAA